MALTLASSESVAWAVWPSHFSMSPPLQARYAWSAQVSFSCRWKGCLPVLSRIIWASSRTSCHVSGALSMPASAKTSAL